MNIHFEPNVPQTLALQEPRSEKFGDYEITYTLTDGRLLKVSKIVAAKINELDLQPGESFGICKQMVFNEQRRRNTPEWTVWLTPESEKARAKLEMQPPMTLADVKRPKIRSIRKASPEQSMLFDRGNGTFGPLPLAQSLRPPRIPFNQAFTEILRFVATGLKEQGEQWNDESKQDMVSTVFIAAANAGLLSLWER
ncbi:MAG TPA: hypothetical protein VKF63_12860 [Terracidiphilus sp.]|nr:hypothetical protein [Terracidiphilus sp.]